MEILPHIPGMGVINDIVVVIPKKNVWDDRKEEEGIRGVVEEQYNYGERTGSLRFLEHLIPISGHPSAFGSGEGERGREFSSSHVIETEINTYIALFHQV